MDEALRVALGPVDVWVHDKALTGWQQWTSVRAKSIEMRFFVDSPPRRRLRLPVSPRTVKPRLADREMVAVAGNFAGRHTMTPERWRQVEDLCHVTLEHPVEERAGFLAHACKGDHVLQREVESLLAQEADAARFMSVPAAVLAGSPVLRGPDGTLAGQRLGDYTIGTLLGVGGMGEVYRAHDHTLGREVAIKVLPPAFMADPERRARFDREARMLATLNHPNIGAIYGLEEADGVRALVLELVEGETLAERIARSRHVAGALSLVDTRMFARQIADALEAAHEKGIIHRDLKPANVKVTPEGVVKVLDFGVAKAATSDGSGPDLTQTREGAVLGTDAYMSPEQTRGHRTDKRTDIWAFGCVLYEMLTGRLAFAAETSSDTIAKILEREPDWSALPSATPAAIRRLLRRCLVKDPKQRLRDIGEVRIAIEADDEIAELPERSGAHAIATWLPWVGFVILAVGVGVWEARRPAGPQEGLVDNARFSRVTDWDGTEAGAEISPDGKFVAFVADRDAQLNLWVSQVGSGHFVNLTHELPGLSRPADVLRTLGFSGSGDEIWFTQAGDSSARKWLMSLSGGTPRAFLGQGSTSPSWSPDDTRLVYFTNGGGDPLFIADRTSADPRPIVVDQPSFFANGMHNHNPVWSPDGQWIYFAHGPDPTEDMNVWRVRPAGGTPEQLTSLGTAANFVAPIGARSLLYVARASDGSGPWLWSVDVETKATHRVTSGLDHYSSVSASRDGHRVVATVTNPTANLWRVPLLERPAGDDEVKPYALPSARALSPRFGGASLFYLSAQGRGDGLWRTESGHAFEVWTAMNDSLSEPPAVSPDGSRVAIIVKHEGKKRLTVMSADGTNARTLAASITIQGSGGQGSADWSRDGAWIVAAGTDATGPGLFKIPVDGGAPVRLVSGQVVNPVWSPDGSLIVYGGPVVGGQVTLLGVTPDGISVPLPEVRVRLGGGHRFLPNGAGLVYLPRAQALDLWLLDLVTKQTRPLTRLGDHGVIHTFDITPDGTAIVFDRSRENSDIVLIDLPK
jgi:Tol biopolymer transport system component